MVEAVVLQYALHFRNDAREHDGDAVVLAHLTEVLQVVESRGIDERHFSHADDAHLRTLAVACHDVFEAVAGTEEVGTVDFIDLHTFGDGEVFKISTLHVGILVEVYLVENGAHLGGFCHSPHEEQTCAEQSYFDGDGEVEDDGEEEREQQDGDVALRIVHDGDKRAPSAHAVGHDNEHSGEACHRDVACQRHEKEEYQHQYSCVYDTGDGGPSAVLDVRHCAGNGSRGRYSAEERRDDICHALSYQFRVGVVVVANHTVCHRCRKQRLDGSEHGNRNSRSYQHLNRVP